MPLLQNYTRAALIVAHPSHELRLHGWLEQARPYVCVLTDGAGRSGESRLARTSEVLARTGATPGAVYGRLSDLEVYSAVLRGDSDLFAGVVEELAELLVRERIDYVVGDAAEGYSVTHDICRVMIGAAVELAETKYSHRIANFDFVVVGSPDECPAEQRHKAIWLQLDDDAFARKVESALTYTPKLAVDIEAALGGAPFQGIRRFSEPQLAGEVDAELNAAVLEKLESWPALKARLRDIIEGVPLDAFRVECLRPVGNRSGADWAINEPLFYELYGERLVAAGHYETVIRYHEHMLPLAEAIRARAQREELWARSAF
jgi:hypothetical protein